jgi:crossover junction endodeoxyribonuclease RuvC
VILGIDPGLASTGFGAITCGKSPTLLRCGHITTSPRDQIAIRLRQIYEDVDRLLDETKPGLVAIENVFSLVRYPRAGILLGTVLGVLYLALAARSTPNVDVTPREVKNSLAGYGGASKRQVRDAVKGLLAIGDLSSFHAADALAVALTAFYRSMPGRLYDRIS